MNDGLIKEINVNNIDLKTIEGYREPLIIKGAIKNHKKLHKWDFGYLKKVIGNNSINYSKSKNEVFPDLNDLNSLFIKSTFSDYLDKISNDSKSESFFLSGDSTCLYSHGKFNKSFDAINKDITVPSFIQHRYLDKIGLWISRKGIKSSLHYDSNGCHNYNIQIRGKKIVRLISPQEYYKLYFAPFTNHLSFFNFSPIDMENINVEKYPAIKDIKYIEGTIEEGDAIYFPQFWHHYFNHTGDLNINLNFWWQSKEVVVNPTSINWLLINLAAQMISTNHPILPNALRERLDNEKNNKQKDIYFEEESVLKFCNEVSKIIKTWKIGIPLD